MIPIASTREPFWRRLAAMLRRRPVLIERCSRCGHQRDDQGQRAKLPRRLREDTVCHGFFDFAGPGEQPVVLCLRFRCYSQ